MKQNKANKGSPVLFDPSDICSALVGLKGVRILHYQRIGPIAEIAIEQIVSEVRCPMCGFMAHVKERPFVTYIDLPFGSTPTRIKWKKHRMACSNLSCEKRSWTLSDHRIAASHSLLTTRAAKWATKQVGGGRCVSEVAKELNCDWGVVNRAVVIYGKALLDADRKRIGHTRALGFDETLFVRTGKYKTQSWCTTICDVGNRQLIDIVESRKYTEVAKWVNERPHGFRSQIVYGTLDMSNSYAAVFSVTLPRATQVVDRFHVIKLANSALDGIRRRVQQEATGHRGRRDDPLYRSRRLLVMNGRNLDEIATKRLETLLELGDPNAEVALAYRVKEAISEFYEIAEIDQARSHLEEIVDRLSLKSMPSELRRLGKTIKYWFEKIMAFHEERMTNGPTEGLNNLIKRVKRVAFGFTNFDNYRIRALLYGGKPNWRVLDSIVVK